MFTQIKPIMSGAGNSNISKPTDLSETVARKLQTATEFKFEGNYFYKKNNFLQAIRSYHRALMYIKGIENDVLPHPLRESAINADQTILDKNLKLKMDCYNNLAACLLQGTEPNYDKIIYYCQKVIDIYPSNDKAYFRMAQALQKLGDHERAVYCCDQALLHQNVKDSKVENVRLHSLNELAKQTSNQKAMFTKMLGLNN